MLHSCGSSAHRLISAGQITGYRGSLKQKPIGMRQLCSRARETSMKGPAKRNRTGPAFVRSAAAGLLLLMASALPTGQFADARAADPRFPDWPCAQVKVPELSVAAVWTGPAVDDVRGKWQTDAKIAELIPRLAARRTPLEEAEKLITEFLGTNG